MPAGRSWWQEERFADDIQVALDQVNEARRRGKVRVRGWELDACKDCFGTLNRIWSTLYQLPEYDESALPQDELSSESVRLTSLLKTLHSDQRSELLARPSVKAFAVFEPSIFSHGARGVVTHFLQDVSPEAREAAAEDHEAFKRGWGRWQSTGARMPDALRRLSRAVLVVRNNMAHGEKTRVGPDPARAERNRAVAKVVLPVLMDMIDFVLDHPSHKFVTYGTLRPRQPGHAILKDVGGAWSSVTLRVSSTRRTGFPRSATPATRAASLPSFWSQTTCRTTGDDSTSSRVPAMSGTSASTAATALWASATCTCGRAQTTLSFDRVVRPAGRNAELTRRMTHTVPASMAASCGGDREQEGDL